MKRRIFCAQKKTSLALESLLQTTKQLIDWEKAAHKMLKHKKMYERLKKCNVKVYFSDRYSVYYGFIPTEHPIKTKTEIILIESDNFSQQHWFARFRRKNCCVSLSLKMIDLAIFLYVAVHVNKSIEVII